MLAKKDFRADSPETTMTVSCKRRSEWSPEKIWYYNAYPEHVELKEGLASFVETIVQKLETSAEEWGDGEEMRAGEKYWGAVNSTIFLRAKTEE